MKTKTETFDWGHGERITAAGLMNLNETLTKKEINLKQKLIPYKEKWLFLDEVKITGNKIIATIDLLNYLLQVNKILNSFTELKIIKRNNSFLTIKKLITEDDCKNYLSVKTSQMPAHLILDYFQLGAEKLLGTKIFLAQSKGKFIQPIRSGDTVKFHIDRELNKFKGKVFIGKKRLAGVWEGEFALREKENLYFSPLHPILETMNQIADCLVYTCNGKLNSLSLIYSKATVNGLPFSLLKEKIPLKVEITKIKELERGFIVKFAGEVEEKIFWYTKKIYHL